MTPLVRNCHRLAVAAHLCGLVLFSWCYALDRNPAWALLVGWVVVFGARSLAALRKIGKDRGGE